MDTVKDTVNAYFDENGDYTRLSIVNDLSRIKEHLEEVKDLLTEIDINASKNNLGNDYSYANARIRSMKISRTKLENYVSETIEQIARVL